MQHLVRPLRWAFFRAQSSDSALDTAPLAVVLAPTALVPPVHAIEASEGSRGERAFFELPAGEGDRVVARGDAWFDDIRTRPRDARRIPVWAVLHPCGECNATLPALRSLSAWMSPAQHAAVAALQLPWSLESELHALRVWPSDAYLDLADRLRAKLALASALSQTARHGTEAVALEISDSVVSCKSFSFSLELEAAAAVPLRSPPAERESRGGRVSPAAAQ